MWPVLMYCPWTCFCVLKRTGDLSIVLYCIDNSASFIIVPQNSKDFDSCNTQLQIPVLNTDIAAFVSHVLLSAMFCFRNEGNYTKLKLRSVPLV